MLINSIIAVNWVLSKLTKALSNETIGLLSAIKDNVIVISEPNCNLDNMLDNDTNTRKELSTWTYRNKVQNPHGN